MQKVRRHPLPLRAIGLRPLVGVWFQVLLTPLIAVLFIVQSPYWFTIGHRGVFSLGGWSARLHTEFHELRATLVRLSTGTCRFRLQDYHPLWSDFPDRSASDRLCNSSRRPQPRAEARFGLFRFRSPLLTESLFLSFPPGTEMFQFPAFAPYRPIHSAAGDTIWLPSATGFPIRKSPDQRLFASSPELIAGYHVLHRLSMPRHPPYTLSSLTISINDCYGPLLE